MKDTEKTEVTFYVATYEPNDNEEPYTEVIAVFVDTKSGRLNNITFDSYAHLGQHSICSQSFIAENCRKANKTEYKDLFNELEDSVGYNLKIV